MSKENSMAGLRFWLKVAIWAVLGATLFYVIVVTIVLCVTRD